MKLLNTISVCFFAAMMLALGLNQDALAKGRPNKVEVTNADPGDAFQGELVDVVVSGSGFDESSDVSYLVTGTTDASQVVVESVQYVSPNELVTRIRPEDNAAVTDYDIEVRTSSGRKGKGTTLFRVKQSEASCVRDADPVFPSFVYMVDDDELFSIFLSSSDGCDQQALLLDEPHGIPGYYSTVRHVRFAIKGSDGVVVWANRYSTPTEENPDQTIDRFWGMEFSILNGTVQAGSPVLLDTSAGGWIGASDVIFLDDGSLRVVYAKANDGVNGDWELHMLTVPATDQLADFSSVDSVIVSGCFIKDSAGNCYDGFGIVPKLNADGTALYFSAFPDDIANPLGVIELLSGAFGEAAFIWAYDAFGEPRGVSAEEDMLAYRYRVLHRKNGRVVAHAIKMLPLDYCSTVECAPDDGVTILEDIISGDSAANILWQDDDTLMWRGRPPQGTFYGWDLRRYRISTNQYLPLIDAKGWLVSFDTLQ